MSTETAITDPADRAVHAAADAAKANLNEGVSTTVASTEAVLPGTRRDPFGDRKALFAKADTRRDHEAQQVQEDNPSVKERVQAMEAEARGETYVPGATTKPPEATTTSQTKPTHATLNYNGRQISVAQSDIDAAGGQDGYLRQRQLDDSEANFAVQVAAMKARQAELDALTEDLKRRQADLERATQSVAQGAPATSAAGTAAQDRNGPAASADNIETEASRLVDMLFSGDPADATKAIRQVLTEARQSKQNISADEVAELAAQKLRATQAVADKPRTEASRTTAAAPDPRWERTRQKINDMAEREFPVIAKDPKLSLRARQEISRLYLLPENKDRLAVDVAREACQLVQQDLQRAQRIELKQGLPGVSSAGGAAPVAATDEDVPTGSDFVRMMAARRNFNGGSQSR